jgi:hypothetical protein
MDKGFTQGGSNADSLLADSFIKGIKAGIDWEEGFKAMVKDATVMGDFEVEGRGSINSRERLGFVPVGDNDHPPSRGANTRFVPIFQESISPYSLVVSGAHPDSWNMPITTSISRSSPRVSIKLQKWSIISTNRQIGTTSGTPTRSTAVSKDSSNRGVVMGLGFLAGLMLARCFGQTTVALCTAITNASGWVEVYVLSTHG